MRLSAKRILLFFIVSLALMTKARAAGLPVPNRPAPIIIGSADNYPPFSWKNYNGKPTGFLVELTEAVTKKVGLAFELKMDEWNKIKSQLQAGEIDAVDGMFYTLDRDLYFDFSEPHSIVTHSIFVWQEEKNIHTIKDLRGRRVLAIRGDVMHEFLLGEKIGINLILTKSLRDAVKLLSLHRGEAAVLARLPALYYMKEMALENIKEAGKPLEPLDFCFAVKKGNQALLAKLNEGLAAVKASGEYDQIKKKWFAPLEPRHEISEYFPYLAAAGGLFVATIAFLWVWNWVLQREVRFKTESLRLAHRRLQKIDEFKTEVVHMVAHDVRAPLGVMQGYLDLLGDGISGNLESKQKDMLQKIQNSVDRMNRLVSDLLDMAQIESGKLELHLANMDAEQLASDVAHFFESQFSGKKIGFSWELQPPAIFLEVDRDRIEQCLINLISNAIKHTPKEGEIKLLIKDKGKEVYFEIHDTGDGIERRQLARLFRKFEGDDRRKGAGYGLGLVITQGLVQLHRGKIWVRSKEGQGSIFAFSIPKFFEP